MGGELGGPGGEARFRPQRLELTHFVTGSVNFFVVFHAFRNLYTPPKTPFFPTGPLACLWLSGVFPHILLILEHKIGCFVVVLMVFSCKSRCVRIVYIYRKCLPRCQCPTRCLEIKLLKKKKSILLT